MTAPTPESRLTGLRVVVSAMIFGLVMLTGVVIFSALQMNGAMIADPIVAAGFAIVGMLVFLANLLVMPRFAPRWGTKESPASAEAPFQRFASFTLLRVCLLEGAAVLTVIGFLTTRNFLVLIPWPLLFVSILMLIPTQASYQRWQTDVETDSIG